MEFESPRDEEPAETPAEFGHLAGIAGAVAATQSELPVVDPAEHNIVFLSLVTGDNDIVGLVAYSIYKQNKYDWLVSFSRHQSRMPNADEAQSYLYGESTPRRLATYRHLAEATLDGRGLEVPGASSAPVAKSRPINRAAAPASAASKGQPLLIGIVVIALVAIGVLWFFHGGAGFPVK